MILSDVSLENGTYTANVEIVVDEAQIVSIDGERTEIPARVVHDLYPRCQLRIECVAPASLVSADGKPMKLVLENGECLDVLVASYDMNSLVRGEDTKYQLMPIRQPCVTKDENLPIESAQFAVLNFIQFFGASDKWDRYGGIAERLGNQRLKADGWEIEICAVRQLSEIIKILKRTDGCAVTHVGNIRRRDKCPFSASELSDVVDGIESFLSFVRSKFCSIMFVRGKGRDGAVAWSRWGSRRVTTGYSVPEWFNPRTHQNELEQMFPKFVRHGMLSPDRRRVRSAIDWYLKSEESSVDVGIILSQAALESLSAYILERDKRRGETAADFIRAAFVDQELERYVAIPGRLSSLRAYIRNSDTEDGFTALTRLRNNLIHTKEAGRSLDDATLLDAARWAQWCIEMCLLRLFQHEHEYRNRVEQQYAPVPWLRK